MREQSRTHRRLPGALAAGLLALLALALLVSAPPAGATGTARSLQPAAFSPQPSALRSPPAALALLHGRVLWKNSEDVAAGVALVLRDAASKEAIMQGATDATGWYTLTVGVGTWLVDIPSTATYYGYAQEVTALPHGEYLLDFAISPRPASDTAVQPTAVPPTPAPTAAPPATDRPTPGTLPTNGQPADPALFVGLGLVALVIIGLGLALLRRSRG